MMNRMRSVALPALWSLGGLGLWGSSATAQYVGGGTPYAPGYYYAQGPGYYGSGYYYATQPTASPYYYVAPAPYYAAPAPSLRYSVRVLGRASGRNYPAPSDRPVPLRKFGLEPQSLPAQIAEDIAPAPASRLGPTQPASRWRGRTWWRSSRNW
jgi:hypothetical protein